MEITIDRLLKGKATIIKNKEYLPTKDYVELFINTMKKFTNNFIVNVQEPDQKIVIDDNDDNFTFNKVWIQAIIPGNNELKEVYNFVYGLDLRTPLYKIYKSYITPEGNPCVFNSEFIIEEEIKSDEKPKFDIIPLMEKTDDTLLVISKMKKSFIDPDNQHELLGTLIERSMLFEHRGLGGKTKLSPTMVVKAYENVYMNSSSNNYVKNSEESSFWNFYNSFTTLIKDTSNKDIINNFEKIILVGCLFDKLY